MLYEEYESRHLRVAYYAPDRISAREAAELFGELVIANLHDGADVRTVEEWARYAGKYGRLALEAREAAVREWAQDYSEQNAILRRALCGRD